MANDISDYSPLVTIVTPSFNQGRFIRETIESVLRQDYPNIEYIIVDGGSKDDTISILKEYGDRISWVSEKDNGQSEAINKGWKMGKGQIFAWLNSDDTYLPGAVTHAVNYLNANKNVMAVYGEGWHIKENGEIIERYPTEPFNYSRLAETCYICQPTVFIRKELINDIGCLDEKLNYCMDYDYWIRAGKKYLFGYNKEYLANSRLYAETKTLGQQAKVREEVIETQYRHFRVIALPWLHDYCNALLENKFNRKKIIGNISYTLAFSYIFFLKYFKYNKRLTRRDISYFCIVIRKHLTNLWNRGGKLCVFF